MGRAQQVTDCAQVAWLLVPPHLTGTPAPEAPISPQAPWVVGLLARVWPQLDNDVLMRLPVGDWPRWWLGLDRVVCRSVVYSAGLWRLNLDLSDATDACTYALLRLLPPELLAAAHTVDATFVKDGPITLAHTSAAAAVSVDLHFHLLGGVPDGCRWRALMSGSQMPVQLGDEGANRTGSPSLLIPEARMLRLHLAEQLGIGILGWDSYLERQGLDDLRIVGRPLATAVDAAGATVAFLDFISTSGAIDRGADTRAQDPVAVLLDQAEDGPNIERRILRACLWEIRVGGQFKVAAARYIQLRCAVRAWLMASPGEYGLLEFARRYRQVGHIVPEFGRASERGVDQVDVRRPCAPDTASFRWTARVAYDALVDGGATGAELRCTLGNTVAEVAQVVAALLSEAPPEFRIGVVQQLHRSSGSIRGQESAVAAAALWRGVRRSKGLVRAVDLAGPEAGSPPWRHRRALLDAHAAGMNVIIHAGEVYDHPLIGLHWMGWCLDGLPMHEGDRVSHALALLERPRLGLVRVRDWAAALGWAAGALRGGPLAHLNVLSAAVGRLQRAFPGFPSLAAWETAALTPTPFQPSKNSELWTVSAEEVPPATFRALVRHVSSRFTIRGVPREVCPTSNQQVAGWPSRFVVSHAPVGMGLLIGSDDPGILGTSMSIEMSRWEASAPGAARRQGLARTQSAHANGLRSASQWGSLLAADE